MKRNLSESGSRARRWLGLALVLGFFLAPGAWAQYTQKPPPQPPPKPPTQPSTQAPGQAPTQPETPPVNKEEEDAYKAFYGLKSQDIAQTIELGEAFLQKYPESRYRDGVYPRLAQAYLNSGKDDKVIVTGEKGLEANPNNVDVLVLMTWFLSRRVDTRALDAEQRLQKVENYGKHALELINLIAKPETMTEEEFARTRNEKLAMTHSGLGLFYYHRNKIPEMTAELDQATKLDPTPDMLDFFLLGTGNFIQKKYVEASAAFERCGQKPWAWQDRCKKELEKTKAAMNSLGGTPPAKP